MNEHTLLVVEDEPATQEAFRAFLDDDYHVIYVDDGKGALSALEESRIDLVLLDYILPDTDGVEVLRKLRRKQAGLPVILISAYATSETLDRASALGMSGFVKKPFGVDNVLEQIARALKKTRGQARFTRVVEPVDPYITQVVSYLRSHLGETLSCEKLLEIAHLSRPTFFRRFKEYVGKSFKAYVNELRMERAKELLVEDHHTILQVGQEIGLDNPSYFSKRFRAYTGLTPSGFRRKIVPIIKRERDTDQHQEELKKEKET
ncbi:MAG: response regulator transcription factor [Candidatus Latescibacteria bacterium]|nr:response regulator transcription factor [Candidatus Latescibacterota bacterium]